MKTHLYPGKGVQQSLTAGMGSKETCRRQARGAQMDR